MFFAETVYNPNQSTNVVVLKYGNYFCTKGNMMSVQKSLSSLKSK